jgi:hypothetical protein
MDGKSKVKNAFLDIYNLDMNYLYSLKLPPNKGHLAYSVDYDQARGILYVLYDDLRSLLRYQVK